MGTDSKNTRAFNLNLLRHLHGGHEVLARKLSGIANWKYLSDFARGARPVSQDMARAIEHSLDLAKGWLDRDQAGFLNCSSDEFESLALMRRATPEIREAVKTILRHAYGSLEA